MLVPAPGEAEGVRMPVPAPGEAEGIRTPVPAPGEAQGIRTPVPPTRTRRSPARKVTVSTPGRPRSSP